MTARPRKGQHPCGCSTDEKLQHGDTPVARNLFHMRIAVGMNRREASEASGLAQDTLRKLEAGDNKQPDLSTLKKLAVAYRRENIVADIDLEDPADLPPPLAPPKDVELTAFFKAPEFLPAEVREKVLAALRTIADEERDLLRAAKEAADKAPKTTGKPGRPKKT